MISSDMKPILINHVFTDDDFASIYDVIDPLFPENFDRNNLPDGIINANDVGYFAYVGRLPDRVYQRISHMMESITNAKMSKIDVHFARYSTLTGSRPRLVPHYDQKLEYPSYTFSIQLKTTLPWMLYAERDGFLLEDNQALIFSGSHQVHWRPSAEFGEKDYFDILVCQAYDSENNFKLSQEHRDRMMSQMDVIGQEFVDIIGPA
jgi:hypothetical protein